jgi:DNA repair exonuclease SbcCD nuclease subunit
MALRILHTADWQLGKPFKNIAGDAGALLRAERFSAVERIAALAAAEQVAAVLVAGDVFDSHQATDRTIDRCLQAMSGFTGAWVLLPGNHDPLLAECVWQRLGRRGAPANVIVARDPAPIVLADGRLVVLPAPLTARRTFDDLTAWMETAPSAAGAVRVGLAHGSVAGRLPAEAEAHNPIAPERAERAGLAHLALGDWHGTLEVARRSWYSGTPEPEGFKDNDSGNVLLVELPGAEASARVTRHATGGHRWRAIQLRLEGVGEPAARVEAELVALPDPSRTLVALRLDGSIGLGERIAVDAVIDRWKGRLRHLRVDDAALVAAPGAEDLALLADGGVIGAAVARLDAESRDGPAEARAEALLALRLLWREQQRLAPP